MGIIDILRVFGFLPPRQSKQRPLVSVDTFEFAVSCYFKPMAKRLGLPIVRRDAKFYEIPSRPLTMQVRLESGHHGYAIFAGVYPTDSPTFYFTGAGKKKIRCIGIANFAAFNGVVMQTNLTYRISHFLEQAKYIQEMTERFCAPYIKGEKNFNEVVEYVEDRKIKREWKFPKNVREEWKLPETDD